METFRSREELSKMGLKAYGEDVLIGKYAILYHPERLVIGNHVRIDDFTVISGNVTLGNYIHISHFCGLYGGRQGIVMEDFSTLASKCSVYAESDDYSGRSMTNPTVSEKYEMYAISEKVKIEKHVIVGSSSVILPGVTLKEGTAVGSMTLCNKSTEPWSVNVGAPVRKLKDRNKDILDLEKQFLKEAEMMLC